MINGKDKTVENIIHKDQISILPKGCLISSTRYMTAIPHFFTPLSRIPRISRTILAPIPPFWNQKFLNSYSYNIFLILINLMNVLISWGSPSSSPWFVILSWNMALNLFFSWSGPPLIWKAECVGPQSWTE